MVQALAAHARLNLNHHRLKNRAFSRLSAFSAALAPSLGCRVFSLALEWAKARLPENCPSNAKFTAEDISPPASEDKESKRHPQISTLQIASEAPEETNANGRKHSLQENSPLSKGACSEPHDAHCIHGSIYRHMYVCMYVCVYVCLCVCTYI